jgi:hypothetical protein
MGGWDGEGREDEEDEEDGEEIKQALTPHTLLPTPYSPHPAPHTLPSPTDRHSVCKSA